MWCGGLVHAIVDDGKWDVLEPEDLLRVVVGNERSIHFADTKLKGVPAAMASTRQSKFGNYRFEIDSPINGLQPS